MPEEKYVEPSKPHKSQKLSARTRETKKPILKIVKNVHEIENLNHKDKASCGHGYVYS